jgi:thiamine-phosphate pyrophosphorylase
MAAAGMQVFQLRAKGIPDADFLEIALKLRKILRSRLLLINDRVDIAALAGADGVHLGQDDVPVACARLILGEAKTVGISAGTRSEVLRAIRSRPDYVSLGPAFSTKTKRDAGNGLGPGKIRALARHIPGKTVRVAVGGITADNVGIILRCGVDAVASASGLLRGPDRKREVKRFMKAVRTTRAALRE